MINFDKLPTESPNQLPKPGIYKAKVVEATMKQPKDESKPLYLNMKYTLTNNNGKAAGTIYDMMFDSDTPTLNYKLGRFLQACGIPLKGSMALSDIAKLVVNKEFAVDVKIDEDATGKYPDKAVVDIFSREVFYPIEQYQEIYDLINQEDVSLEEANPTNAQDTPSAEVPFNTEY